MAEESNARLAHGHVILDRPGLDLGSRPAHQSHSCVGSWWDLFLPLTGVGPQTQSGEWA